MKLLKSFYALMEPDLVKDAAAFFLNNEIVICQVYFPEDSDPEVCVMTELSSYYFARKAGLRFGFVDIKNPQNINSADYSVSEVLQKNNTDLNDQVTMWSFESLQQMFNNIDGICRNGPP